jgi:radical SAM superfamily enzyme YgiQ (UPF0313 family)
MNILLIRAPEIRRRRNTLYQTNITGIYPPLGLSYIASYLRKNGYNVKILDLEIFKPAFRYLKEEIKKFHPQVALLTVNILNWPEAIAAAKTIKSISPEIIIGIGGPSLSLYPKEFVSHRVIDFGVYGEGEDTILEVLKHIEEKEDLNLENIKGCIFKKDEKAIINPSREEIFNLDKLPFPAIDLLPFKKYFALSVKIPFFTLITSRGCPFNCKFCYPSHLGKYRSRSPGNVAEEMELYVKKYGIREIIVFDDTFGVNREIAIKICEEIIKRNLKFSWEIRTRVDLLNKDFLGALNYSGCRRIHLGIESGSAEILQAMNKNITLKEIKEKIKLAKRYNFEVRGYFMIAYPGETLSDILSTIEFAKNLPLDWASFTITVGFPGTAIYEEAVRNGYFPKDYWKEYVQNANKMDWKLYFLPETLQVEDLYKLKRKAYLEFYLRPSIIWRLLKYMQLVNILKNLNSFINLVPYTYSSVIKT